MNGCLVGGQPLCSATVILNGMEEEESRTGGERDGLSLDSPAFGLVW